MSKDYYKVLEVDKNASQDEIKKAFRKKAHQYHPDKKDGDEAKFKEVNEAYQILGNEQKRKQYDQFGDSAFSGQGFGGTGMNWEDFVRQAQQGRGGMGGVEFDMGDLGDIFGDIFGFSGRGGRGRRSNRGADIQTEIELDFKEAIFGTHKDVKLYKTVACSHCKGNKAEPGTPIETCQTCNGSGVVTSVQRTILGAFQSRSRCPHCQGEGKIPKEKCKQCGGSGLEKDTVELRIDIPAGIEHGQTIKLAGQGEAAPSGSAGDLYVRVRVKGDARFERDGMTIRSTAEISISQAVLGDKIDVETVDGEVTLKIPAGTQSGQVFTLRGKGAPGLHGRGRGDHLVTVDVRIPKKLSRAQRKLFEQLQESGE